MGQLPRGAACLSGRLPGGGMQEINILDQISEYFQHPIDEVPHDDEEKFEDVLKAAGVRISMDGKRRWIDNVFIERLWRSVKYEEIYLHAYESSAQAHASLRRYFVFYNTVRTHQHLAQRTPDEVYYALLAAQRGRVA